MGKSKRTFRTATWIPSRVKATYPVKYNSNKIKHFIIVLRNKDIIDKLKAVNRQEGQVLMGRWASEECLNAIMEFMMRKRE